MALRTRLLNRIFSWLYGPLVFLHEPAGRCLFGAAWHGRRCQVAEAVRTRERPVLDLGCGAGHLLTELGNVHGLSLGIDPSRKMLKRARKRGCVVLQASAHELPFRDRTIHAITITYPGPWIRNEAVWREAARVLRDDGLVVMLIGGTVTKGRFSSVRRVFMRLAYGAVPDDVRIDLPPGVDDDFEGTLQIHDDRWGHAYYWCGRRRRGL